MDPGPSRVFRQMGLSRKDFGYLRDGIGNLVAARAIEAGLGGGSHGATEFFVHNGTGGSGNDGLSFKTPRESLDAAMGLCTANQGDIIYLMPGHVEDSSAAATWEIDVAGVSVIGLGHGSARPRFDFNDAAASIDIGASGCILSNVVLRPSVTAVLIAIDIVTLITDTLIHNVEAIPGEDGGGVDDFAAFIELKVGCDRTIVSGCKVRQHASGAGYVNCVHLSGATDDVIIDNCDFHILGAGVITPINGITTLSTNVNISNCRLTTDAEPGIELLTGTTGTIENVNIFADLASIDAATVADGMAHYNVEYVELAASAGVAVKESLIGDKWYVDSVSGGANNSGMSPDTALTTIDAAINAATASNGDEIHVLPKHVETISTATFITCDVVGLKIIGHGDGTDRPTLTFDTGTDSTIVMSAANVTWENFLFINTQDGLVVGFPVTAAYCGFTNCEFQDAGADNTVEWITLSADADYFHLVDCTNRGTDTAGNTAFITGAAADHVTIQNLRSHGDFSAANIDMSAAWTDCLIEYCTLENLNAVDVCIEGFSAATGWVRHNAIQIVTDGEITYINTVGTLSMFENYGVNVGGETGQLTGTVSTT